MHLYLPGVFAASKLSLMLVGAASGLLWTLVYVLILRQGLRDKSCGMPFGALCMNIMWEFLYTFVFPPCSFRVLSLLINFTWFALDVGILITWWLYWRNDRLKGMAPKSGPLWLALGLVSAVTLLIGIQVQFNGGMQLECPPGSPPPGTVPPGGITGFLQNFMMSALFVYMLMLRNSTAGQSLAIALSKQLGTALASLYFYMSGITGFFWIGLYILIFVWDSVYTVMMMRSRGKPASPQVVQLA
jgi:hypothetical protein